MYLENPTTNTTKQQASKSLRKWKLNYYSVDKQKKYQPVCVCRQNS